MFSFVDVVILEQQRDGCQCCFCGRSPVPADLLWLLLNGSCPQCLVQCRLGRRDSRSTRCKQVIIWGGGGSKTGGKAISRATERELQLLILILQQFLRQPLLRFLRPVFGQFLQVLYRVYLEAPHGQIVILLRDFSRHCLRCSLLVLWWLSKSESNKIWVRHRSILWFGWLSNSVAYKST